MTGEPPKEMAIQAASSICSCEESHVAGLLDVDLHARLALGQHGQGDGDRLLGPRSSPPGAPAASETPGTCAGFRRRRPPCFAFDRPHRDLRNSSRSGDRRTVWLDFGVRFWRTTTRPEPGPHTRPMTAASAIPSACSRATSAAAAAVRRRSTARRRSADRNRCPAWPAAAAPSPAISALAGRLPVPLHGAGHYALPPGTRAPPAAAACRPARFPRPRRLAAAMAARCPARPKPVTSVQAWAPSSIISSEARRFSAAIDRAAASIAPGGRGRSGRRRR